MRPTKTVQLEAADVSPIIHATRWGEIHVIAAPPGGGKSTAMYAAVAALIAEAHRCPAGEPYRVVWATHGTRDANSLGEEARRQLLNAFRTERLSNRVRILKGFGRTHSAGAYYAQFRWSKDTSVYVVSHAHLPLLLAPSRPPHYEQFMADVDLVVIDEDPLDSLVYSLGEEPGGLTPAWILWNDVIPGKPGTISQALHQVMQQVLSNEIPEDELAVVEHPITGVTAKSLTGRPFWTRFVAAPPGAPDWARFQETLQAAVKAEDPNDIVPDEVVEAMREDFAASSVTPTNSQRFGVVWEQGKPISVRFRANVLRTLRGDSPPILVLDAYADAAVGQYQAVFQQHQVKFRQDWPVVPLDVEVHKEWHIHRKNLLDGDQEPKRKHLLGEIGELTSRHKAGTLVLSYREVTNRLKLGKFQPEWAVRLKPPLTLAWGPAADFQSIEFAYWFAGRGVNAYRGRHVVALHPPAKPSLYQAHFLAAIEPHSATRRERMARHLRVTELLQMLHRGRQTTFELGDPDRPRVITVFDLDKFDRELRGSEWLSIAEYVPLRSFTKWAKRPHQPEAVLALSCELLKMYGGLPHLCLVVLGLYTPRPAEAKALLCVQGAMLGHPRGSTPLLNAWQGTLQPLYAELGEYKPATGIQVSRVLDIFRRDSELAHLQSFQVMLPAELGGGRSRVYAEDERVARAAMFRLTGYDCHVF
ncbi:hypothetical protein GO986_00825 [Deinococcus sp. HMF7620]|uniref:Uncharacterized protein n=1 Tax=Deinococcus arboris TaxID=2682977 RepID=A0A7C9HPA2_9DEIO|nr:hypothetical protein [Deinococcus arboris]MVN85314.1 hypothetical protein [Deinococcus arboris]